MGEAVNFCVLLFLVLCAGILFALGVKEGLELLAQLYP